MGLWNYIWSLLPLSQANDDNLNNSDVLPKVDSSNSASQGQKHVPEEPLVIADSVQIHVEHDTSDLNKILADKRVLPGDVSFEGHSPVVNKEISIHNYSKEELEFLDDTDEETSDDQAEDSEEEE